MANIQINTFEKTSFKMSKKGMQKLQKGQFSAKKKTSFSTKILVKSKLMLIETWNRA